MITALVLASNLRRAAHGAARVRPLANRQRKGKATKFSTVPKFRYWYAVHLRYCDHGSALVLWDVLRVSGYRHLDGGTVPKFRHR